MIGNIIFLRAFAAKCNLADKDLSPARAYSNRTEIKNELKF